MRCSVQRAVMAVIGVVSVGAAVMPAAAQVGPPMPVWVDGRAVAPAASAPAMSMTGLLGAVGPMLGGLAPEGTKAEGGEREISFTSMNPLTVMSSAARALPNQGGSEAAGGGSEKGGLSTAINILLLLTVIGLAPSIVLMATCFMRMLIVLGFLRQAIGTQSIPPPQVVTALALFMTLLVMAPTVERIQTEAVAPFQRGEIRDYDTLWLKAKQPLRDFMFDQIEATGNWSSLYMLMEYRGQDISAPETLTRDDVDMVTLVPAYMLSELKVSFLMGFRVYLPFLVIDMVISTMLISMSMMMLPPVLISLPFKLLLFVLVDGWALVVGSLMHSFVQRSGVNAAEVSMAPVLEGVIATAVRGMESLGSIGAGVLGLAAA